MCVINMGSTSCVSVTFLCAIYEQIVAFAASFAHAASISRLVIDQCMFPVGYIDNMSRSASIKPMETLFMACHQLQVPTSAKISTSNRSQRVQSLRCVWIELD
jgi:hypothetical protein